MYSNWIFYIVDFENIKTDSNQVKARMIKTTYNVHTQDNTRRQED